MIRRVRLHHTTSCLVLTLGLFCASARAAEVLDNSRLIEMVRAGISLQVVLQKIATSECHFDSASDKLIELQKAGKEGGLTVAEIAKLQEKVIEVSGLDQKRLRELAEKAINSFENSQYGDDEYNRTMDGLMQTGRTVTPYLLKHINDESERKRAGVADALGRIGYKADEILNAITIMLTDRTSKPVRLQAAQAVARLKTPETCALLLDKLASRNDLLDGTAMALGYLGDPRGIEPLAKLLKLSGDSDARVCAAWALGQLRARQPVALDALLGAVLDERDAKLRDSAAQALAQTGERRVISHIISAFHRFRPGRDEIIRHLAYFKDAAAIEFLITLAEDDNPAVRKSARETLSVLAGGESYDTKDEWNGWWVANKDRLDFAKSTLRTEKLPEPGGGERQPVSSQQ